MAQPAGTSTRNLSTPESRAFWASCERIAAEVATWPHWQRGGINVSEQHFESPRADPVPERIELGAGRAPEQFAPGWPEKTEIATAASCRFSGERAELARLRAQVSRLEECRDALGKLAIENRERAEAAEAKVTELERGQAVEPEHNRQLQARAEAAEARIGTETQARELWREEAFKLSQQVSTLAEKNEELVSHNKEWVGIVDECQRDKKAAEAKVAAWKPAVRAALCELEVYRDNTAHNDDEWIESQRATELALDAIPPELRPTDARKDKP